MQSTSKRRWKNISRPIRVWQWTPDAIPEEKNLSEVALHQRVRFAAAPDGVQLAWASIGEGPPLLKAPNWLNHLEYEWRSPVWGPVFAELARHCRLVRFDQRGNGLSDWEVGDISARMNPHAPYRPSPGAAINGAASPLVQDRSNQSASRANPTARAAYAAMRVSGKPAKVAIIATARKTLVLANTLVNIDQLFDPNYRSP